MSTTSIPTALPVADDNDDLEALARKVGVLTN